MYVQSWPKVCGTLGKIPFQLNEIVGHFQNLKPLPSHTMAELEHTETTLYWKSSHEKPGVPWPLTRIVNKAIIRFRQGPGRGNPRPPPSPKLFLAPVLLPNELCLKWTGTPATQARRLMERPTYLCRMCPELIEDVAGDVGFDRLRTKDTSVKRWAGIIRQIEKTQRDVKSRRVRHHCPRSKEGWAEHAAWGERGEKMALKALRSKALHIGRQKTTLYVVKVKRRRLPHWPEVAPRPTSRCVF